MFLDVPPGGREVPLGGRHFPVGGHVVVVPLWGFGLPLLLLFNTAFSSKSCWTMFDLYNIPEWTPAPGHFFLLVLHLYSSLCRWLLLFETAKFM